MRRTVRDDADAPRGLAALVLMYVIIVHYHVHLRDVLVGSVIVFGVS